MNGLKPYFTLLHTNTHFRRLWLSQAVSNFGDWFGILALYAIIAKYSGSEFLIGLIIIVKMLSLAFFSPLAGYFVDRFNRKNLMIWCDILRAVVVFCIVFVQSEQMLWIAFVLTSVQMMLAAIFEPAKTSSIPNVTSKAELVNANIISTATWSIVFTSAMAIGGFATEWLGTDVVFILDALTYLVSAWFIYRAVIPQTMQTAEEKERTKNPFKGIFEGVQYLQNNRQILRPGIAKGSATAFLGGLVYLLIIVNEQVLMMGSIGLGLLYAARGFGTGIGPILGRRLFKDETKWVGIIGICILFAGMMYMVVGLSNNLYVMILFVLFAHAASGANWVMSTVLLQNRTEDVFRGRTFSTEWLLFTLANSISVLIASLLLDFKIVGVKPLIMIYGFAMIIAGIIWLLTIAKNERVFQEALVSVKSERV